MQSWKSKQFVKAPARKLEVNKKEIHGQKNYEIKSFFGEPFKCHRSRHFTNYSNILDSLDLPSQITEQKHFCELNLATKKYLVLPNTCQITKPQGVKILLFRTILPWYFYIKWQGAIRLLYKKGVKIKDCTRTEFHH